MKKKGVRLGQHFLTGTWAARKLTEAVAVQPTETILEIGPGKGALTRELLATGAPVVAVEKDEKLVKILKENFKKEVGSGQFTVHSGDIRDFDAANLGDYVLAANIPYYITGEITRKFLTAKRQPKRMALLIQKEVAERILGARCLPAGRQGKESILSIAVKVYGQPKIAAKVSRGNFFPPPSVDSAILVISDISKKFFQDISEELFFKVVRAGFASKRKLLASNLGNLFGRGKIDAIFIACKIPEKARAEDLTVGEWRCVVRNI
ncbi:MAG: 16S rRNA (adenine(1518)-N(6)/adenine(1519)-N(6))-dimethyltransferase RsmA [bacterium]|nr:16S rRNA (adenine(1518)-N(6)/adenine(1519)-N(6))-dimethyltransferase RsmA [bacterium]